jgi:hypothetical protein
MTINNISMSGTKVDYQDSFSDETLSCDLTVNRTKVAGTKREGAEEK